VCVCEREREREKERVCVCVCEMIMGFSTASGAKARSPVSQKLARTKRLRHEPKKILKRSLVVQLFDSKKSETVTKVARPLIKEMLYHLFYRVLLQKRSVVRFPKVRGSNESGTSMPLTFEK